MTGEFGLAVHALVFLSHRGSTLSSETLAENICTNPARVRKVMAMLKKAGLLETKEGAEGGYHFTLDPAQVTLRQVGDAVGAQFVSAGWRSGGEDMDCLIASGIAGVMDRLYDGLNALCLARLGEVTLADVSAELFHRAQAGMEETP